MKRLLLVTYYFPPSGGPGVQRSLKFVKYLPEFGWDVTVLTVDPACAAYPDLDPGLQKEIPSGTSVIRTRARDPYAAYARMMGVKKEKAVGVGFLSHRKAGFRETLARWFRANLFLPDARVGWTPYGKKAALEEVASGSYDAILSTGPPHSTHLIALKVKRATGLPWILDLRDAWPPESFAHLLPMTDFARLLDRRTRNRTFDNADLLVTVSNGMSADILQYSKTPVEVIPNGFDARDFQGVTPIRDDNFTIVYTGNLSAEQDPTALWNAIKEQKEKGEWSQLRVRLVGNIAVQVIASIENAGLGSSIDVLSYVEHDVAIQHMVGAELLLLCINNVPNPGGIVTGKLYEYLATGRPIICFSGADGEAARIVQDSGAGDRLTYEDSERVVRVISRHYQAWKEGAPIAGAAIHAINVYDRRSLTRKLAESLSSLTSSSK